MLNYNLHACNIERLFHFLNNEHFSSTYCIVLMINSFQTTWFWKFTDYPDEWPNYMVIFTGWWFLIFLIK